VEPELSDRFRHTAFFIGPNVREAVQAGRADFMPVFLSEIPRLIATGDIPVDVALIHVSPPDEHGFCSYGVGVECTKAAAERARQVVALVNPRMPRSLGDSFIHVTRLGSIVEVDRPVLELPHGPGPGDVARAIGAHVAELIEDGATLQMGIGEIPDAVLLFLKEKRNLGIHTEMFSDGVVDLAEAGVITNRWKHVHPGRIVTSFVYGTERLYRFVHDNPFVEFHPCDYTNDTARIRKNDNVVAINSALEVDLSGQVVADSIGFRIYSGIGGQMDFMRGSALSKGGKPIIALLSTAAGGTVSRIVPVLKAGSGVVTTRGHVHWVVTEYGAVNLFGLSLRQRAEALISIAHPDVRGDLRRDVAATRHVVLHG
jgi:acetyl-CoA hydrolase